MADGATHDTVDQARLDAGQAILDLTDRLGFDARAAGWLYDRPANAWRYLLVSPMLVSQGPHWVYERLLLVFRKYGLPAGVSPLDIYVLDESMEMAAFGPPLVAFDPDEAVPGLRMAITEPLPVGGILVTEGFVLFLRRMPTAVRARKRNPARRFDKTIQKLAA